MKILFDISMLYIDNLAKRGIYYFTYNLLKYIKYLNLVDLDIIPYPITIHPSIHDTMSLFRNIIKLSKQANVDTLFIPHVRTFTHIFALYIFPKSINVVIHDVHFLMSQVSFLYKVKMLPRYMAIRDVVQLRDDVIITTVSKFSKWAIAYYLHIDPSRVFAIYPGVDEVFKPIDRIFASRFVKEKYGIEKPYFIYSGAVSTRKGVRDLIEAFKVFNKNRNYMLVITGPLEDVELLKQIRTLNSVKYLGHVPRVDMPALFSAAVAAVFPSYHEGFGLPPLEAAACSTPVIASRIPVFLETLADAGIFVRPGDVEGIANAMSMIADNEDLRVTHGLKALNRARIFSWLNTAKEYVSLWRQMIA